MPTNNNMLNKYEAERLWMRCSSSQSDAVRAGAMTSRNQMNDYILEGTDERRRRQRRLAVTLSLGIIMSTPALALDVNHTPWSVAAQSAGLDDPLILRAIALAESGLVNDQGFIEPWPWALNIEGRAYFPASRDEAAALLSAHQDRSVDVGLLQINIRWHGHRVDDPKALLDPVTNLEIGAEILNEALASASGDLTTGIGRYHSSDLDRGHAYARTVLAFYRYLIHGDEEMRHAR